MLKKNFADRIQIAEKAADWKDAIEMVVDPLEKEGIVEKRYLQAIYENVAENGDYFIIMPGFAIPHTRPENGALKNGLSFLKLRKPVTFSSGQEVSYLIALAATDADEHMDTMSELAELLMDDRVMQKLEDADSLEKLQEIFA
ncbi:PTS sugar transporter subunit IIA [Eubacterium ramulus]